MILFLQRRDFGTLRGPILTELGSNGKIYVGFTDSRDAKAAFEKVQKIYPGWYLQSLTAREFAGKSDAAHLAATSDYEGHIFASVFYNGHQPGADRRILSHNFKAILERFGEIKAFLTLPTEQNHVLDFLVEYFDTRAAENVVSTLNGTVVDVRCLSFRLPNLC